MADILTLDQARAALNWSGIQNHDRDGEIVTLYIPAVTAVVESICGPITATPPIPAPVLIAARIILAQMWNADHQGRPQGGTVVRGEPTESVPVGFAVPRRAEALLAPYALIGGFA